MNLIIHASNVDYMERDGYRRNMYEVISKSSVASQYLGVCERLVSTSSKVRLGRRNDNMSQNALVHVLRASQYWRCICSSSL